MEAQIPLADAYIPYRFLAKTVIKIGNDRKHELGDTPDYHTDLNTMLDVLGQVGADFLGRQVSRDEVIEILTEELENWWADVKERQRARETANAPEDSAP